jgi:hypothetical protein
VTKLLSDGDADERDGGAAASAAASEASDEVDEVESASVEALAAEMAEARSLEEIPDEPGWPRMDSAESTASDTIGPTFIANDKSDAVSEDSGAVAFWAATSPSEAEA